MDDAKDGCITLCVCLEVASQHFILVGASHLPAIFMKKVFKHFSHKKFGGAEGTGIKMPRKGHQDIRNLLSSQTGKIYRVG